MRQAFTFAKKYSLEHGPLVVELAQVDLGPPTASVVFSDWKRAGTLASA